MKIEQIYIPEPHSSDRPTPLRQKHSEGAAVHTFRAVDHEKENNRRNDQGGAHQEESGERENPRDGVSTHVAPEFPVEGAPGHLHVVV